MADFALLESPKLISRKVWVIEKSWNFHTVYFQFVGPHFENGLWLIFFSPFQYTDELTPFLEWLEESIAKSTREINSNSVAETEEIMTRHEKNLDQLDKKKKVYMEQKTKAEKLANDPKSPKFMQVWTLMA